MASIIIAGDTSGAITLASPAVAGSNTLTLPSSTDTLVGKATTDTLTNKTLTAPAISSAVMTTMASSVLTSATAQATTSGTSIDFTGIPLWAKRITVMFNGVSTNGTSDILIRIGSGSIVVTGYFSYAVYTGVGTAGGANSTGFKTISTSSGQSWYGFSTINLQNSITNSYCSNGLNSDNSSYMTISSGSIALAGVLDRVRITTVNGTDTFDAGSINIMYE